MRQTTTNIRHGKNVTGNEFEFLTRTKLNENDRTDGRSIVTSQEFICQESRKKRFREQEQKKNNHSGHSLCFQCLNISCFFSFDDETNDYYSMYGIFQSKSATMLMVHDSM